ncbi:MAG: DUF2125 domain-containing protein [Holosporales bacterium]|jgi:hypothetical protein|nr:DUF2125 domain-containing protein [Holosporales bacterium]
MKQRTKRRWSIIGFLFLCLMAAVLSLPFVPSVQHVFLGRLIREQGVYQHQGGQFSYTALDMASPRPGSLRVTCREGTFVLSEQRARFSFPEAIVSWTILRPGKLKIIFSRGAVLSLRSLGTCRFGNTACLTLPISWKNMRPYMAPFLSGSIYFSTDTAEIATKNLISYKGEDLFLALKRKKKSVVSADGHSCPESVLDMELSVKHLGSYLGTIPLLELEVKAKGFLSHPYRLLQGIAPWKETGGYIECEEIETKIKELKAILRGSVTLARTGTIEDGVLTLDLSRETSLFGGQQEGGILRSLQAVIPFLPIKMKEGEKCGERAHLPVTIQGGDWFIDDIPVFRGKACSFCPEALEPLLMKLREGVFEP